MFVEIIFFGLQSVALKVMFSYQVFFSDVQYTYSVHQYLSVRYKIVDFIRVVVNFAFILTDVKLVSCHF